MFVTDDVSIIEDRSRLSSAIVIISLTLRDPPLPCGCNLVGPAGTLMYGTADTCASEPEISAWEPPKFELGSS